MTKLLQRVTFLVKVTLLMICMICHPAFAEDFPSRPIKIIVGFDAGSSIDVNIRTIAPALEKILGVPIVVDDRPGAVGAIAWNTVSKSKPDGYTLGSVNYPAIAGTFVIGGLPFDPLEKFTFLGNFIWDTDIVAVRKDSPYKNLGDMISYLKKNPNGISYAANGPTSIDGLIALSVGKAAGVKFRTVNFQGDNDLMAAVLGGHVDVMALSVSLAVPMIENGDLRPIGVTGPERNPLLPNVPTFVEQGYPLAVNAVSRGILMPAGADPAIVAKLQNAIKAAVEDPEYLRDAKKMLQPLRYVAPDQVASDIKTQIEFLRTVLPSK